MKAALRTRFKDLVAPFGYDRLLLITTIIAALIFFSSIALVVKRVSLIQQRVTLNQQRAELPLRQISRIQRQTLLLQHSLSMHESGQSTDHVYQDTFVVANSTANLLRSIERPLMPQSYVDRLVAVGERWQLIRADLDNWLQGSQDLELSRSIQVDLSQIELVHNNIYADINLFSNSLNVKADQLIAEEGRLDTTVGLLTWIMLGLLVYVFARLSRDQLNAAVERESMRKFPDQNPNPVMRFDPRHALVYGNSASKEIEPIFAMRGGRVTKERITKWLDQTFQEGGSRPIESSVGDRIFRLVSSLVAAELVVNVYGFEITNLKRAEQDIRRQLSRLKALRQIDLAIASLKDLNNTLEEVLSQTRHNLGLDAATIFILNDKGELYCAAFQGYHTNVLPDFHLHIGESLAGHVARDRNLINLPDLAESELGVASRLHEHEAFVSYFAAPLEVRGQLLGVIEGMQRRHFTPDQEWLDFFATLAGQAAIALDNASLFDDLKASNLELVVANQELQFQDEEKEKRAAELVIANQELRFQNEEKQKRAAELVIAYETTLEGWAKALELRDKETEGHSRRVTETTMLMVKEMGLPEDQWDDMRRGAILHDIGKMGVPDAILLKPAPLDAAERAIIHQHTEYARQMLSSIPFLSSAMAIPSSHHERWDGSGYPQGLKGEDIPLPARIFAIADVWDAIRSDRPYRAGWPKQQALQHIQDESGHHFDPQVVAAFMRLVNAGKIE